MFLFETLTSHFMKLCHLASIINLNIVMNFSLEMLCDQYEK